MGLLGRLFSFTRAPGKARNAPPASQMHSQLASGYSQQPSMNHAQSANSTRRELLRLCLRDTLTRHGIPVEWIVGEALMATSRTRETGIHWRIVVKHWEPRLMTYGVALQQALLKRVIAFDPMASNWLMGISWQFALADESMCPPMPQASTWTMDAVAQKRAELERMMAQREAEPPHAFAATEPAKL